MQCYTQDAILISALKLIIKLYFVRESSKILLCFIINYALFIHISLFLASLISIRFFRNLENYNEKLRGP